MHISRRRRARLPHFQPGRLTARSKGTLDSAVESGTTVATVVVLAAWLSEEIQDSMPTDIASYSGIWTDLLPTLMGVAPQKMSELRSRLQGSQSAKPRKEEKSSDAEVDRLHRCYDSAWKDFKACVKEQAAVSPLI